MAPEYTITPALLTLIFGTTYFSVLTYVKGLLLYKIIEYFINLQRECAIAAHAQTVYEKEWTFCAPDEMKGLNFNMGKKNIHVITVFIFLLFINLAGCGRNEREPDIEERIVFGFSQLGDESEWRTSSSNDIKRAAEKAGVQLIFENAQQKQFNQIKAIRSFILNGVDVIAFSPIVEEGWDNILMEAKAADIPVILVDRNIKTDEEGLYCAFIGSDFNKEGVEAGKWMVKRFAYRADTVKVAEISGTINSSPTIGRQEGLREVFNDASNFQVVISISGDFMRSKGKECMETILNEVPDIDILYAHNDDMALGAIEVLEERGIKPGKDIAIVSVDAQKSGLEALKQGKINCLAECNPYIGDELMNLVFKIVNGEEFPAQTYTEEKVFTDKDDMASLPVRP